MRCYWLLLAMTCCQGGLLQPNEGGSIPATPTGPTAPTEMTAVEEEEEAPPPNPPPPFEPVDVVPEQVGNCDALGDVGTWQEITPAAFRINSKYETTAVAVD